MSTPTSPAEFSNPSRSPARETDHLFVNNVRFFCIMAIVAIHSGVKLNPGTSEWWQIIYLSLTKFGTIGFFLISGFLLGERFQTTRAMDYLAKRIRRICMPWCVWFVLFTTLIIVGYGLKSALTLPIALSLVRTCLWQSSFWFVPNLLFAMTTLLLCRRWLYDLRLGGLLLLFSLFYSVNIYTHWVSTLHTTAFFGFVFYLWLGANVAYRFARFSAWMRGVPVWVLWTAVGIGYLLSLGEAGLNMRLHMTDPNNTIRLSNQIFSVLVVCLIFKLRQRAWPSWLDVRQQAFGIYLSHMVVLLAFGSVMKHFGSRLQHWGLLGGGAAYWTESLLAFGVTVSLCCLLTRQMMSMPSLAGLIGANAPAQPAPIHLVPLFGED